jgi:hypothetical protein
MKKKKINVTAIGILFMFFAINSFGQITTTTTKSTTKKSAKLDKTKVPKVVTDTYYNEYPVTTDESWYGYPTWDNGDYWYDYDPYFYTDANSNNYAVDFYQNGIPYTVIYSASGQKIAAHKKKITDIPTAITAAINAGTYKTWTIGKDKEEIFKASDADQMKVYKINVAKGSEKHTLYFRVDGTLLKDKNCLKHSA